MPRLLILSAFALFAVFSNIAGADCKSSKNTFIRSVDDLIAHERIHAANVRELIVETAKRFPQRYSEVLPYIVEYSALHDLPKGETDIAELLCKIYGLNLEVTESLSAEEQRRIAEVRSKVIQKLNDRENALKSELFSRLQLTHRSGSPMSARTEAIIQRLEELEKVADNVERVGNPISAEEMGKVKMDAAQSFNRYLGKGVTPERAQEMRAEAWEMLARYNARSNQFTAHIAQFVDRASPERRPMRIGRSVEFAQSRVRGVIGAFESDFGVKAEGEASCLWMFRALGRASGASAYAR